MFWFSFFFAVLTPILIFLIGLLWKKHPPKEINGGYGYRTSMSMKNQDTWDYAHKCVADLWYRWGGAALAISAAVMLLFRKGDHEKVLLCVTAVQIVFFCLSIVPVERALRKRFDKNGIRRNR